MHHLNQHFFSFLAVSSICAAGALLVPTNAQACSPPPPGLSSHIPEDGAWYPANGILIFQGVGISLDQVKATIDGAPATLVDASAAFPIPVAALAARISPKPNPDQKVTVSGTFCAGCPTTSFTFSARPDDLIGPEGVVSPSYGVHDYADFKSSGGDCQNDSDLGIWVRGQSIPASEEEAPAILQIEAFADNLLTKPLASRATVISSNEFVWGYRVTTATLQGTSPTGVCFRLSTKDLAGNAGPAATVLCNACYSRTESQASMTGLPPDEPKWGVPDTIKGGPCDWGAGVGGGPEEDGGSCSYSTDGSSSASASWMLLACAALGFRAARRRTPRRSDMTNS